MKLDATKFGIASAGAFAIIWTICSVFVMLMPETMMEMSGQMVHADLSAMRWNMGLTGVLFGLIAWSFISGITGWLIGVIYNRMLK